MYSYGLHHMDEQRQDDLLALIYNTTVLVHDVDMKTCRERWTTDTGGERVSVRSILAVHDEDDGIILYYLIIILLY